MKPHKSASHRRARPVDVAVLAFPETTASVVFGLYDVFASAGRDWGFVVDGQPGPALMRPTIVSRHSGPMRGRRGHLRPRDGGAAGRAAGRPIP